MAAYYNLDSPVPYFYLAKCFFLQKDRLSALDALNLAIEYSEDLEEYHELRDQALEVRKILVKRK
jgi:hypothetical protein